MFDMTAPEVYKRTVSDDGKVHASRTPNYPPDWQNQFGLPITDHQGGLVISMFKDAAVFGMERDPKGTDKAEIMHPIQMESEKNDAIEKENIQGAPNGQQQENNEEHNRQLSFV